MSDISFYRFQPVVWRGGTIMASVVGAAMFVWTVFIFPEIDRAGQDITTTIHAKLKAQTLSYQKLVETHQNRTPEASD